MTAVVGTGRNGSRPHPHLRATTKNIRHRGFRCLTSGCGDDVPAWVGRSWGVDGISLSADEVEERERRAATKHEAREVRAGLTKPRLVIDFLLSLT